MPTLSYSHSMFTLSCKFQEREIPRAAGFRWDAATKGWYSFDLATAFKLRDYADKSAKRYLNRYLLEVSPYAESLSPAPKGEELYPHQTEAALFSLSRNFSYLGLDPGLGKTAVAATIAKALGQRVVYICPPFLLYNVMAEFRRWGAEHLIYIFPDTYLTRAETIETIAHLVKVKVSSTIIIDEAHRFKNFEAKRTQALLGNEKKDGLIHLFTRRVFMSGTPMPNRPMELFPVLSKSAPQTIDFKNSFQFGVRYCAGFQSDFGWDFSGASNLAELRHHVIAPNGPFMLRMKKDLLKLPPKIEELFVVSSDMSPRLAEMEKGIGEKYADIEDVIKHQLAKADGREGEELHTATYRRLLGVEKVKAASGYIDNVLAEGSEAVIVFAYHKDVVQALTKALADWCPIVIDGSVPTDQRQALVKDFQENKNQRLVIANYVAAGVGFTLTKATRIIFLECSWVPGENDQASDRAHRIGQDKTVLVQYVVYKDSLDKAIIETLIRKRKALEYI